MDKYKLKNSKLSGIYTWKINSKIFPISLWKNGKVSLGISTWSFLNQTNTWVMREDSCTFGKYHVNYTLETIVTKFLSQNSCTKQDFGKLRAFLHSLQIARLDFRRKIHALGRWNWQVEPTANCWSHLGKNIKLPEQDPKTGCCYNTNLTPSLPRQKLEP